MDNIFTMSAEQLAKYFEKYNVLQDVKRCLLQSRNIVNGSDLLFYSVEAFLQIIGAQSDQNVIEVLQCIKSQQLSEQQPLQKPLVHHGTVLSKDDHIVTICCPTRQQSILNVNMLINHFILSDGAQIENGSLCELIYEGDDLLHVVVHNRQYQPQHPSSLSNIFMAKTSIFAQSQGHGEEVEQCMTKSRGLQDVETSSHSLHLDNNFSQEFVSNLANSIYQNSFFNEHETSLANSHVDGKGGLYSSQQLAQQSDTNVFSTNQYIYDQDEPKSPQKSQADQTGSFTETTNSRTKFCLRESVSQRLVTKFSLQPQQAQQFRISTGLWAAGRVSFLIDNIAFIAVPRFQLAKIRIGKPKPDTYSAKDVQELRTFDMAKDLGVVVATQLGCCTFEGTTARQPAKNQKSAALQRGDIVRFELVPGYAMHYVGVPQGNQFYPLFGSKYGVSGQKKQPGEDFADYYAQLSPDEPLTCFADKISVIDRIERSAVSRNYLIYQNTYHGVIYTFNDQDGYGFIKAFGELKSAKDYGQGFEVYFKLQQDQRKLYVPQRGDLVRFKSHWVDEKAQARDIRLIQRGGNSTLSLQCVAICPPYAQFIISGDVDTTPENTGNEKHSGIDVERGLRFGDLGSNLVFLKLKSGQVVRLGQKVQAGVDLDISSYFKAVNVQLEAQASFQTVATKRTCTDPPALPWARELGFRRSAPLFGSDGPVREEPAGALVHFDAEVRDGHLFLTRSGLQLTPDFVLRDPDSIADLAGAAQYFSLYQAGASFAITAGERYSGFQAVALSIEHVFFRHESRLLGFLVRRVSTPNHALYLDSVALRCALDPLRQYECVTLDGVVYVLADAEVVPSDEADELQ